MIKVKQLTDGFSMTDKSGLFKIKLGPVPVCLFSGFWLFPVTELLGDPKQVSRFVSHRFTPC